jgi:hypothetical protein
LFQTLFLHLIAELMPIGVSRQPRWFSCPLPTWWKMDVHSGEAIGGLLGRHKLQDIGVCLRIFRGFA